MPLTPSLATTGSAPAGGDGGGVGVDAETGHLVLPTYFTKFASALLVLVSLNGRNAIGTYVPSTALPAFR